MNLFEEFLFDFGFPFYFRTPSSKDRDTGDLGIKPQGTPEVPAHPTDRAEGACKHHFTPVKVIRYTKPYINSKGVRMERFKDVCLNQCLKCGGTKEFELLNA